MANDLHKHPLHCFCSWIEFRTIVFRGKFVWTIDVYSNWRTIIDISEYNKRTTSVTVFVLFNICVNIIHLKYREFITTFISQYLFIKNTNEGVTRSSDQCWSRYKCECGNVEQIVSVTCVEVAVPEIHHRSSYRTSSRTSGHQRGTM